MDLTRTRRSGWAVILVCGLAAATARAEDRTQLRASMQSIFASIQVLLPLSVDDDAFADPANRERITQALRNLAQKAGGVASHTDASDRSMRFLAGSLEREAEETLYRYQTGEVEGAQFFVQRLTDFCVACHSRLPSAADSPVAADFVSEGVLAQLPPPRRATLQAATRRFDDAMTTEEKWIARKDVHPAELLDPITDYLIIAIRVKGDLKRPIPTLEKLAARPDLWVQLRADVQEWIATLRAHAADAGAPPSLEHARRTLDEARAVIQFPSDRRALVHYLLASSELHRWLDSHPDAPPTTAAQAYYLLGLIETRISGNYWVSEPDFYLETAIRLAPQSEAGRDAFALYEEETLLGWSGSGGVHLPEDVKAHLDELRKLVEKK